MSASVTPQCFNVNTFANAFENGGLRQSLFCVEMHIPPALENVLNSSNNGIDLDNLRYNIRSTSIPAATVGTISVPYMGRTIKVSGDRTYADWSVTVINDELSSGGTTRRIFEAWNQCLNTPVGNIKTMPYKVNFLYDKGSSYKSDANVFLLAKWGGIQETYTVSGIFPYDLPAFNVDWGSTDSIIEFDVTFAMDYWTTRTIDNFDITPSESLGYMADDDLNTSNINIVTSTTGGINSVILG